MESITRFTESDWKRLNELDEMAAGRRITPAQNQERRRLGYRLLLAASVKIGVTREQFHPRNRLAAVGYDQAISAGLQDLAPVIAADIAAHLALNKQLSEVEWRVGTEVFYAQIFNTDEIDAAIAEIKDAGLWPESWIVN
jgi:hypothetical protein